MSNVLPPTVDPLRPGKANAAHMGLPRLIRVSALALALAGVASFGVIVYSAYQGKPTPDQVPLITADNSPLRERPVDEGGMIVANRDSTVYSQLDGGDPQPGLERLMPAPEQPVSNPAALDPPAPADLAMPRRPDGTPALTEEEIRIMQQQRRGLQHGDAGEQAMEQLANAANNLPPGAAQGQISTVVARTELMQPQEAPAQVAAAPEVPQSAPEVAVAAPEAPVAAPKPEAEIAAAQPAIQTLPQNLLAPRDPRLVATQADKAVPAAAAPVADNSSAEQPIGTLSQAQIVAQATHPVASSVPPATPSAQEERQAAAVAPAAGSVTSAARAIQLGAVRTEEGAKAEWTRLQAKFSKQLGSLQPQIQQADLGARGIYWRIRGGSVSEAEGRKICEALKAAGQSCLVVPR